jgi:hypothetical protein
LPSSSYSKLCLVEYAFRIFVKDNREILGREQIIALVNLMWGESATSTT